MMNRNQEPTVRDVLARKRQGLFLVALFVLIFRIYAEFNHDFAEWYSVTVYHPVSLFLHRISSVVPFSLGEALLLVFLLFCLTGLILFLRSLITKREKFARILAFLQDILCIACLIFAFFTALSGMNYVRCSFSETYALKTEGYTAEQLEELCVWLCDNATEERSKVQQSGAGAQLSASIPETAKKAAAAYAELAADYETLCPDYLTVKPVFFSVFMSYAGITGVYSPFTAEANINDGVPGFTIPFTMCHELTHLQGYMQEEEANFLAFLACMKSRDHDLRYSGFFHASIEAMNALYKTDREAYLRVRDEHLSAAVREDIAINSRYWDSYEGFVEEISTKVNDTYLKVNSQPSGVASYGESTGLMLAWYFGETEDPVLGPIGRPAA